MSGKEILVDTNILIYLMNGDSTIEEILQEKRLYISFISELELLGYKNISAKEEKLLKSLLNDCIVLPINEKIKQNYIFIRKNYPIKLADSIIVATSITNSILLITADKQLKQIKELDILMYNK
jgi:predicted nucleic acid-binding protein